MKSFDYFKITFVLVAVGLTVGLFVYGILTNLIFDENFSIVKLGVKSLVTGIVTGLVLGILNIYLKIFPFKKREN